jgi:hypothetical protein
MKNNSRAFTILEVMLAIFILTAAVAGSFSLIQQTLWASSLNQSKLIAYYLGQEGIEIVRNIRDNNWLEQYRVDPTLPWDDGLDEGDYIAAFGDQSLRIFEDTPLYINDNGFYDYAGTEPTTFKRKITIDKIDSSALKVTVEVSWEKGKKTYAAEPVVDYLYNWYGY